MWLGVLCWESQEKHHVDGFLMRRTTGVLTLARAMLRITFGKEEGRTIRLPHHRWRLASVRELPGWSASA